MPSVTPARAPVAVITTVFNEAATVVPLLDSVLGGTMRPAEVVVADGGSTDGTVQLVGAYAADHPEVRLLTDTGGRSAGRNAAISSARHQRLVCIDAGCTADPAWLEQIISPFDEGAEWVAGFYRPAGSTALSTAIGLTMVYVREEAERDFLPSARSMAFTRRIWEQVGGFPEHVQFAEDTAFDEALLAAGHRPVFVPSATVAWTPPPDLVAQARTMFAWGKGDGLLGLRSRHYRHLAALFGAGGLALVAGALIDRRLLPLAAVPFAPTVYRQTRYKYRHMDGAARWVQIPLATLNGLAASLAGFVAGRRERRRSASP
jgi:cellulose synthase/poly-beta-1,6-N-acetylglucosamine synthase-like glycosyltransferase